MACSSIEAVNDVIASQDKMLGAHFNARSLRKNSEKIRNFIALFKRKCTFIGISETWLPVNEAQLFNMPGYNIEANCRTENLCGTTHGGTALYVDDNIAYRRRSEIKFNTACCESVWIEIDKRRMKMS